MKDTEQKAPTKEELDALYPELFIPADKSNAPKDTPPQPL